MKDLTFPEYIPPRELQQLYFDFVTDKSVSWVDVAPKDWWQYIDAKLSFGRYKEYVQANDLEESFSEWLSNNGERRYLSWCINSWRMSKRLKKH
ncbi:MAG: hypothetical protein KME30_32185 [Iphinoe sp. HA4291-MV1]|jgi:hypothetical protein|nr:hypothetical protein [Iphinoe sp. HA4291-MV1]